MRRISVVVCLLFVSLAAACGGNSAGALGGKSASQVLSLAETAAENARSFHFVDVTGSGKNAQHLIGDVSNEDGQEELTNPNGTLEVRLVGATVYVAGSAKSLVVAVGLSTTLATKYANKWISLIAADSPYAEIAKAMLPSAELQAYVPSGGLTIGEVTTLDKRAVVPISGTAPSTEAGKAIATLFVSTTAPFDPIGGSLKGVGSESGDSEVVAFTAWQESIKYKAPSESVAYSSLSA